MAISQQDYERLFGSNKNTSKTKDDYGLATSILAGVGSGVFKIFEGAATLAATLADLGVDKNRAEAVEAYFDEINPFYRFLIDWIGFKKKQIYYERKPREKGKSKFP